MRFVLFVEGGTERRVAGEFLKRWLDPQLRQPVGIHVVKFTGWAELLRDASVHTRIYLGSANASEIIAVIGLIDLYGPRFPYPADCQTTAQRRQWARIHVEKQVNHPRFRMFFAVHEIEAWLFSDASIFPASVRADLPKAAPEAVNSHNPPGTVLDRLYRKHLKQHYDKIADGEGLFRKLDPAVAREKCPALKELQDELLALAQAAGL